VDDAQAPDALLSQSLAVLRQCVPTLETAAARAPTVAVELQDTVAALRGVERALHQHRDALQRAEHFATLGHLAAGLSHEIRNPLGALFLHIDLLEEEYRDPTPESPTVILQTFGEIRTTLTRLDELVQDYLSLVRVSTIELGVQDVGAAVQAWAAEMEHRVAQQGVTMQLQGHTTGVPLAFHASTLRRAVLNVVQNAIEAMPNGGTLCLECVHTATEVQLRIRDSGVGMPAAQCRGFSSRSTPPSREAPAWASILCRRFSSPMGAGVTSARRLRRRDQPREGEIWRRTDAGEASKLMGVSPGARGERAEVRVVFSAPEGARWTNAIIVEYSAERDGREASKIE
jgi:light-regulated signal transduction histidine kinase (bacteriophytochrome)